MIKDQIKEIEKGLKAGQKFYPTTRTIVSEYPKLVNGVLCKDAEAEAKAEEKAPKKRGRPAKEGEATE